MSFLNKAEVISTFCFVGEEDLEGVVLVSFKSFAVFHSSVREGEIEKNTNTMGGKTARILKITFFIKQLPIC